MHASAAPTRPRRILSLLLATLLLSSFSLAGEPPAEPDRNTISAAAPMMLEVEGVQVDPGILDYIVRLVAWTRTAPGVLLGASPRGSVGLLRAVRARAYMQGRAYVLPGDVQALAVPVLAHRIQLDLDGESEARTGESVVLSAIEGVHAPQPA